LKKHGVFLANITLAYHEYIFIDRLIFHKDWKALSFFLYIKRYIDDITSIDCQILPFIRHHHNTYICANGVPIPGIYPDSTTLNKEQSIVNSVTGKSTETAFIVDCAVQYNYSQHQLHFRPYDKRENSKFDLTPLRRFPSPASTAPLTHGVNIVTSECHRLLITSSHYSSFCPAIASTIHELATNGYALPQLLNTLFSFIRINNPLFPRGPGANPFTIADVIQAHIFTFASEGTATLNARNHALSLPTATTAQKLIYIPFTL
jgi:hypothetical protein